MEKMDYTRGMISQRHGAGECFSRPVACHHDAQSIWDKVDLPVDTPLGLSADYTKTSINPYDP